LPSRPCPRGDGDVATPFPFQGGAGLRSAPRHRHRDRRELGLDTDSDADADADESGVKPEPETGSSSIRRWTGGNARIRARHGAHLAGGRPSLFKPLLICVICAICGYNCRFKVQLFPRWARMSSRTAWGSGIDSRTSVPSELAAVESVRLPMPRTRPRKVWSTSMERMSRGL